MAERLEALKHAAEATDRAAAADLAGGPRHLAGSEAAVESEVAANGSADHGAMTPLSDDLSLPQPVAPGPAAGPVLSPAGPPPMSPLTPVTPAVPPSSVPPPPVPSGPVGPAGYDGQPARIERPGPPPARNGIPSVEEVFPSSRRTVGYAEQSTGATAPAAAGQDGQDAADTESPAAAIADLLRHGSSSLFFNRNMGGS